MWVNMDYSDAARATRRCASVCHMIFFSPVLNSVAFFYVATVRTAQGTRTGRLETTRRLIWYASSLPPVVII